MRNNSDGPKCHACNQYTMRIGTFSACPVESCERYAVPVNDQGLTDEEAMAEAVKPLVPDDDATGFSDACPVCHGQPGTREQEILHYRG